MNNQINLEDLYKGEVKLKLNFKQLFAILFTRAIKFQLTTNGKSIKGVNGK
jgi:hypothetical protein